MTTPQSEAMLGLGELMADPDIPQVAKDAMVKLMATMTEGVEDFVEVLVDTWSEGFKAGLKIPAEDWPDKEDLE
jgi:hypothetical protein